MSISSELELELSLISFAGSDSILFLGRERIKEGEEGKRGWGGGGAIIQGRRLTRGAINRGTAIIRGNAVLIAYDHCILSSKHAFNRKKKEKKRN